MRDVKPARFHRVPYGLDQMILAKLRLLSTAIPEDDPMTVTRPTGQQVYFVQGAGTFFEQRGMPRIAGRILEWLLICDPPHQPLRPAG